MPSASKKSTSCPKMCQFQHLNPMKSLSSCQLLIFVASSSQQVTQPIDEVVRPSNKKRKEKSFRHGAPSKRSVKNSAATSSRMKQPAAPSRALVDEDENEDEDESEDEQQPLARPRTIFEVKTRLKMKKLRQQPTGTRKISFKGDDSGVNMHTNLPYLPRKLTWKGKSCVTSSQLKVEKEKKISKLKTKKGKH